MRTFPNPENCSLEQLRCALKCCRDRKAQKRLNAIHLLLCGGAFELAREHAGVSERCLQLWIKRFNDAGIDGITYRPKSGRPRELGSDEVSEAILPLVDDPGGADQHHWRVVSLCGWLEEERDFEISYRILLRYLHEHDYARRIPRRVPEPPEKEEWLRQRKEFVPQLSKLLEEPEVDVFFGDEAGFEGDPRPRVITEATSSERTVGQSDRDSLRHRTLSSLPGHYGQGSASDP